MPIELTEEQRQHVHQNAGRAVEVVDPQTRETYMLIDQQQFEKVRSLLTPADAEPDAMPAEVPIGILRSQQAFWRDLPELLKNKRNLGKWVCYRGDERIGIGKYEQLIRECNKRGLRGDEYDLDVIEPHGQPPWEPEEVESGGHEVDY